jgi:hypothetical protein
MTIFRKAFMQTCLGWSAILVATVAVAGQMMKVHCAKCDYDGGMIEGGLMAYGLVNGCCTNCSALVTIRWERNSTNRPMPMATAWDPTLNRNIDIYRCPRCTNTFLEIKDIQKELRYCPRCRAARPMITTQPGEID